jgi:hypothetical protein
MGENKLMWGYYPTDKIWVPIMVDAEGKILEVSAVNKLNEIGDVNAPTPADDDVLTWDAVAMRWVAAASAGADLTTHEADTSTHGAADIADKSDIAVDANLSAAAQAAIAASHARQHAITTAADHTSTATAGKMLKADANGLPVEATNTDAEVGDAVTKKHTQNTDSYALDGLSDVNAPTPADNEVLTWDDATSKWINAAPAGGGAVATDPIWDVAGDVAVGTGANTAAVVNVAVQQLLGRLTAGAVKGISVTELFYNLIMSLGIEAHGNLGAAHTLDMSAAFQHSGTVDQACTISITDPGVSCMCRIRLTKSADATARALTWQKTGGGGTFLWAGNVALSSLTQNAGVYDVILWRVAADTYDCSYITMGF